MKAKETTLTTIRIPSSLYASIKEAAGKEIRSINNQILYFIKKGIENELEVHQSGDEE